MKYFVKNIVTGKIYTGKAEKWQDVSIRWYDGERLYNPYSGQTVWGWNDYKKSMKDSWDKRNSKRI